MTAALTTSPAPLPAQSSSPFGFLSNLTKKVERLDAEELLTTAAAVVEQQDALTGPLGSEAAAAAAVQPDAGIAGAGTDQAYAGQGQLDTGTVIPAPATATAPATAATPATAASPAIAAATVTAAPPATVVTPGAAAMPAAATPAVEVQVVKPADDLAVPIPTSAHAPRTKFDYWKTHIAQFRGKYLEDGPEMRPNCGPASVTMALRMVGLDVPGAKGERSEKVLDQARFLATGSNDYSDGTSDAELETLVSKAGAKWSESSDFTQLTAWAKQGIPVVLSGNPAKAWNSRYSTEDVQHFDGGHWVTVSGYDPKTGYYIVNDPLSQIGPINVSEEELRSYNLAHGRLGIAVFR